MRSFIYAVTIAAELLFSVPAVAIPQSLTVRDLQDHAIQPFDFGDNVAVAFIFIAKDCPVSNGYAPEINRICSDYGPKKVRFVIVDVDQGASAASLQAHAKAFGYVCPVVSDKNLRLTRVCGATVTPEAVVYASSGALAYRGRIDDRYLALGEERPAALEHDLRDALDAVLSGKPAPKRFTKAVGCFIPGSAG